jgi:LysM repeat protein
LANRGRYADLFKHDEDDYESWAKGLRAAGYATDKKYPEKLISLIERFQLYKFDEEVLGTPRKEPNRTVGTISKSNTHEVMKGDTMYSLSKHYNISVQELQRLNGMKNYDLKLGQRLIIKSN